MSNIYYDPDDFDLEIIGSVGWRDQDYEFDLTVVWRDQDTGKLYYADDSGCSCPAPFETTYRRHLTEITTAQVFIGHVNRRLADADPKFWGKAGELVQKVRDALNTPRPVVDRDAALRSLLDKHGALIVQCLRTHAAGLEHTADDTGSESTAKAAINLQNIAQRLENLL